MDNKLKPGFCGVCDINQIWYRVGRKLILTELYTEFSFVLSDGLLYRHAICKNCIVKLDDKTVDALLVRIKASWEKDMAGWATNKHFIYMRSLKLEAWHQSDKKVEELFKVKKEKDFNDHLKEVKDQKKIAKEQGIDLVP